MVQAHDFVNSFHLIKTGSIGVSTYSEGVAIMLLASVMLVAMIPQKLWNLCIHVSLPFQQSPS